MAESLAEGAWGHNHVYNILYIYISVIGLETIEYGITIITPFSDDFVWKFPYSIYSRMTTYIQTIVFTSINYTDLYSIISSSKLYNILIENNRFKKIELSNMAVSIILLKYDVLSNQITLFEDNTLPLYSPENRNTVDVVGVQHEDRNYWPGLDS